MATVKEQIVELFQKYDQDEIPWDRYKNLMKPLLALDDWNAEGPPNEPELLKVGEYTFAYYGDSIEISADCNSLVLMNEDGDLIFKSDEDGNADTSGVRIWRMLCHAARERQCAKLPVPEPVIDAINIYALSRGWTRLEPQQQ